MFQVRRQIRIQTDQRSGGPVQDGIEDGPGGIPFERKEPSRHFVKQHAERKQIGASVQRPPQHLLRRHVGHRAQRRAGTGKIVLVAAGEDCVFSAATLLAELTGAVTFAKPKSRIFACPRLVMKMFAGLMSRWTIPSEWAASSASAISMADDSSVPTSMRLPAMRCFRVMPSRYSMAMKALAFVFADFVNGADVGVVQRGRGTSFPAKTLKRLRICGHIIGKKLEGDEAAKASVFGFVNHAHPPAAQFLDDAVVRDGLA